MHSFFYPKYKQGLLEVAMRRTKLLLTVFLGILLAANCFAFNRMPLNAAQLRKLVVGNSMIGTTCHTGSTYLLYFYPDGKLYFEKNKQPHETYMGTWTIKGDEITSQWPTYKRTGLNILRYYKIGGNVYVPYNVNHACGPAGTFGHPFMVIKGIYTLKKLGKHSELEICNDTNHCKMTKA